MIKQPLKFFIIAGEPSGDFHGGNLINSIKNIIPYSSFIGHGGNTMGKAGMRVFEHTDNLAIMGFIEIIKHLPRMFKILNKTVKIIEKEKPDRIILIDYPGFNLRLAKKLVNLKIPITYFILPQAWAWKENRVETMKQVLDQALSIFPFEKDWYESRGLTVNYIGHPLIDTLHGPASSGSFYNKHNLNTQKPLLLLMPGSRQQEIDRHWPIFLNTIEILSKQIPKLQFIIGKSPYVTIANIPSNCKVEFDCRKAMIFATAAIVASGTATLECAVENTPMVVCYKLSSLSWGIANLYTKIRYSSIVNLIANNRIIPELLQTNMTAENIALEITPLLNKKSKIRKNMVSDLNKIKDKIGPSGVYNRAALAIIKKHPKAYKNSVI